MKLGRDVSRHNELNNWRNTHRYESVMATIWLFLTISETDPGLWDRLLCDPIVARLGEYHELITESSAARDGRTLARIDLDQILDDVFKDANTNEPRICGTEDPIGPNPRDDNAAPVSRNSDGYIETWCRCGAPGRGGEDRCKECNKLLLP